METMATFLEKKKSQKVHTDWKTIIAVAALIFIILVNLLNAIAIL